MSNLIPLTGMSLTEFVPSAFKEQSNPPTFFIRVPTFAIRDKMSAVLFQRGLIPVTTAMSRAILVNALYELYDEAEAEDHATFLEGYWTKADVHDELLQGWQIREAQRLFDLQMGVTKPLPQEPLPPAPFGMRDQARNGSIIANALDNHEGYRAYQARNMVQREEEEEFTVQLFIDGWKNCGDAEPVRDGLDKLTPESIERLRQWFAEQAAPDAWDEVKKAVMNQFGAPGRLEKNSDSPPGTNSSQSGSQTSSGDLGTSDGNSMTSSITPIRDTKSQATSGVSRRSRSAKKGSARTAPRKNGQTAVAS
jgi:hypothetical protein